MSNDNTKLQEQNSALHFQNDALEAENKRLRARIENMIQARVLLEADNECLKKNLELYRNAYNELLWEHE